MVNKCLKYSIIAISLILILSSSPLSMTGLSFAQSGGTDWMGICRMVESALYNSCSYYVNPDNTLTYEGEGAVKCIKNGALIGGGAASVGVPLGFVTRGLGVLADITGCGGIVNMNALNNIAGLSSIINLIP